jgi:hypothetical protein
LLLIAAHRSNKQLLPRLHMAQHSTVLYLTLVYAEPHMLLLTFFSASVRCGLSRLLLGGRSNAALKCSCGTDRLP